MSQRIGIFGGSFNPVHMGHHDIVKTLFERKLVDRLHIFPTAQNPLKSDSVLLADDLRVAMLKQTMSNFSNALIDLYEIRQKGISYTSNTVRYMQNIYTAPLFLIMGYDCYLSFDRWYEAEYLVSECNLIVFHRKGIKPESNVFFKNKSVPLFIETELPDISSTVLREKGPSMLNYIHMNARKEWLDYISNKNANL